MFPRPRFRFILPLLAILGAAATPAWAQGVGAGGGAEISVWTQAFGAEPVLWTLLSVAAIVTAAIVTHLGFSLSEGRAAPVKLGEAVKHAMETGNYQEAWEACGHWPAAYLSRLLRPALERVGQGRERVEASLARRKARESRTITALTWTLLGVGVVLPALALLISRARLEVLFRMDGAVANARALTLEEGNFVLVAAMAFAVVAAALIFWITLRLRGRRMLAAASAEASALVQDLAYDDLEGLRVGAEFDAGTLLGDGDGPRTAGLLRVSKALTTSCPQCNAPINFSRKTCPHCGTGFEWT